MCFVKDYHFLCRESDKIRRELARFLIMDLAGSAMRHKTKKFFGSFFQKRTSSCACLSCILYRPLSAPGAG
jgi:hypothetical protein